MLVDAAAKGRLSRGLKRGFLPLLGTLVSVLALLPTLAHGRLFGEASGLQRRDGTLWPRLQVQSKAGASPAFQLFPSLRRVAQSSTQAGNAALRPAASARHPARISLAQPLARRCGRPLFSPPGCLAPEWARREANVSCPVQMLHPIVPALRCIVLYVVSAEMPIVFKITVSTLLRCSVWRLADGAVQGLTLNVCVALCVAVAAPSAGFAGQAGCSSCT